MSFQDFINMGGHGFYIWSSYLIATIVFVGLFVSLRMQRNRLLKQLRRRHHKQKEINK